MLNPEMGNAHSNLQTKHSGTRHGERSDVESTTARVLRPRPNKDEMASQRSCISVEASSEPPDELNWLPYVGSKAPIWTNKAMCENLIQKRKHRDWFVAFASALHEIKKDSTQSKMVVKMYVFLREFIPRGLTAVSPPFVPEHSSPRITTRLYLTSMKQFSHINGGDVMEQLLCHPPESTTSRHRVGMHAEAVFKELEEWMSAGTHWQQALSHWKSKPGTEKLLGAATSKKKMVWKAPGLHSPSGILITAHFGRGRLSLTVSQACWQSSSLSTLPRA